MQASAFTPREVTKANNRPRVRKKKREDNRRRCCTEQTGGVEIDCQYQSEQQTANRYGETGCPEFAETLERAAR